jgi:hypothetical protein
MPNEFKIKNGLIVDQGGISITGSALITGSVAIVSSGSSVFTVDGTSGRLFSIDDSLSGSLYSVNTAAGLPVIEAFSDNTIRIGQFGRKALFVSQSKVGIGKETDLNGILDISGSVTITGSLFARGSGSTIISISGSLGELFKVIDTPTNLLAEVVSGSYKALEIRNDLLYTSGAFEAGGNITGNFVNRILAYQKDSDVTAVGTVVFGTTAYLTSGTSFGSMAGTGVFTFTNSGKYEVNVIFNVSGNPDAWGGINGTTGTRYNQWYNGASGQQIGSVKDIISVNANDTYEWKTNNSVTVYGTGNTKTRIQFTKIG